MPRYGLQEYRELDHDAQSASPDHQSMATAFITSILETHRVAYAVTGLMNFYLRGGIPRAVGAVEIVLQVEESYMRDILCFFVTHRGIYRPSEKLQQRNTRAAADGVSKIYVDIQGQLVRVDLKPRGDAANLLRNSFSHSAEKLTVATPAVSFACYLLAIGPLIALTFKDHHFRSRGQREGPEYDALMTLCLLSPTGSSWYAQVRRVAPSVPQPWRDSFLRKVAKMNPNDEATVRWALNMSINSQQTQPLQIGYGSGGGEGGEGGEGSGGGGGAGVGAGSSKRRNRNSPRHGDQSKDGYWTYSGHLRCWYHKHKDGRFSLEASFL